MVDRKFAEGTSVPVERSRAEIERLVTRFGATQFGSAYRDGAAIIAFAARGRSVRFLLPLPDKNDKRFTHKDTSWGGTTKRGDDAARKLYEQETRRVWRALALVVKAKLEAVDSEITTFEHEFLAHIVQADGTTIGDKIIPRLDTLPAGQGPMLALLGGGP